MMSVLRTGAMSGMSVCFGGGHPGALRRGGWCLDVVCRGKGVHQCGLEGGMLCAVYTQGISDELLLDCGGLMAVHCTVHSEAADLLRGSLLAAAISCSCHMQATVRHQLLSQSPTVPAQPTVALALRLAAAKSQLLSLCRTKCSRCSMQVMRLLSSCNLVRELSPRRLSMRAMLLKLSARCSTSENGRPWRFASAASASLALTCGGRRQCW